MSLFELSNDSIVELATTTFEVAGIKERIDLQRLLRSSIHVVDKDLYVIAEEFGEWEDAKRRIDLLCIDREANIVVVELKRTEDGGHMELQALRYAAMVSTLTFENIVNAHQSYLSRQGGSSNARECIRQFLGFDDLAEISFGEEVRILLVSANFSRELTTTVLWLNQHDLDIRCIRLRPHKWDNKIVLDVQQVIPLPEASDYQVKVREKAVEKRAAERKFNFDLSKYDLTIGSSVYSNLTKRALGMKILRAAIEHGIGTEQLSKMLGRSTTAWLIRLPGNLDSEQFMTQARETSKYDLNRFYCSNADLVHKHGETYAISNQWAINHVTSLKAITEAYPELSIAFVKSE